MTPMVAGLRLTERVEYAGSGEVWRARVTGGLGGVRGDPVPGELPGVGECVLRLLRLPVDEAMRSRGFALASDLRSLDDPGLVAIASVKRAHDGIALIFATLPEPVLGLHLLARRRQLAAGEVVTLGVAMAWALDAGHRLGISHGRLRDADVLLDSGGRPRLSGMGVMGVLGAPGRPEDDACALARLLASLLDSASSGAPRVLEVLADRSLSAAGLAARLAAAAPAMAIDLTDPAGEAPAPLPLPARERRAHRARLARRGLLMPAAAIGILVLAAAIGWVSAPGPDETQAVVRPPAEARFTEPINWSAILARLDSARSAVFARPTSTSIGSVDAVDSAAYRYDAAAVQSLKSRGAHAVGLRMVLDRVSVADRSDRVVALSVSDRRPAYEVRDGHNRLISRVAARGTVRHRIELRDISEAAPAGSQAGREWRIATVADVPTAAS